MNFRLKDCKNPNCSNKFKQFNSLQKFCSPNCQTQVQGNKKIKQVSEKRKTENQIYSVRRQLFLIQNPHCFIENCDRKATTVEHIKGRKGFADDFARDNNISLFIDERFWKPCCWEHNIELENNPELSKKYQLSKIHGGKKQEL